MADYNTGGESKMKILVLGANGMFGSMIASVLAQYDNLEVEQTLRSAHLAHAGVPNLPTHYCDVLETDALIAAINSVRPDYIINCTGLIKQRPEAEDVLAIYPINALFPHRLARLSETAGAHLIQFSTDCVFSGNDGNYADDAPSDSRDHYGQSKRIGELVGQANTLTLRTSIIGHEAYSSLQLIDWFLNQDGAVKGYTNAIFSGFPTFEIGRILAEYVLPAPKLSGVYNLSADPISKFELLKIVRDVYEKNIEITPDDEVEIDRSLDSTTLRNLLNYVPPSWPDLVLKMRETRPYFSQHSKAIDNV